MFHAEKLKYAPLQGNRLLYVGTDEELASHLAAYCRSFQVDFSHIPDPKAVMDFISNDTFNYVLVEGDKLHGIPQLVLRESAYWRLVLVQEAGEEGVHKFAEVTIPAGNDKTESALKILDKILALREVPLQLDEKMESVSFDYLRETFDGQDERYRDLLGMMQSEFAAVKKEIEQALEQHDLERFREFKHKIQPSANYLQLNDLVQIMEQVKLKFHELDQSDNKRLANKMMRYFDSVLSALHNELNA